MVEIKTVKKGAELVSINFNGFEKLHDGKEFWNRHSPVLFPIVGRLKDDKMTLLSFTEYFPNAATSPSRSTQARSSSS